MTTARDRDSVAFPRPIAIKAAPPPRLRARPGSGAGKGFNRRFASRKRNEARRRVVGPDATCKILDDPHDRVGDGEDDGHHHDDSQHLNPKLLDRARKRFGKLGNPEPVAKAVCAKKAIITTSQKRSRHSRGRPCSTSVPSTLGCRAQSASTELTRVVHWDQTRYAGVRRRTLLPRAPASNGPNIRVQPRSGALGPGWGPVMSIAAWR